MGIKQISLAALCLYATTSQCFSHTTGNQIQNQCQNAERLFNQSQGDERDFYNSGFCTGFIDGFLDLGPLLDKQLRFCSDPEVTIEQANHVLLKYLNEHPERTHENAYRLALQAFKEAWPCN